MQKKLNKFLFEKMIIIQIKKGGWNANKGNL